MLDFYSFVQVDSLRMALWCQNMQEFHTYHELDLTIFILSYFIKHIHWLISEYIRYKNVTHKPNNV